MKKAVTRSVFGLFLWALLVAACKDPNAVSTPVVDAAASSVTPVASATPATQCTTDADCRTHASYCQETPCACQVLGKAEADPPKCSGAPVSCLVNPCARKTAACQNGKCELVVKSAG